jgi:2-hydroxy-6-oxonona-2,4-dienedioate hydrolase
VTPNPARYRAAERRLWTSLGIEPAERQVVLRRLDSSVRVQSAGEGDDVVFLHGATTSGSSWADLVAVLPGFRCHLVDRPGTGLSPPLRRPVTHARDLTEIADLFLVDLLDGLDLPTASIVATSFGGYFALRAAAGTPDRIRRLVLFGWSMGARLGRMPVAMRLGAVPGVGSLMTRLPVNDRAVRGMFRGIGLRQAMAAGRVSDEAISTYAALINHTPTLANELRLSRAFLSPIRGLTSEISLPAETRMAIDVPILFLWGTGDSFGGVDIAREFSAPFPRARLEMVEGAGHAVWMDDVHLAATRVHAFLAGDERFNPKRLLEVGAPGA